MMYLISLQRPTISFINPSSTEEKVIPFAFHRPTWCFSFALICHWISIVFLLYDRRIATHSVDPSLTHFLGEFPGLGLALVPSAVLTHARAPRLQASVSPSSRLFRSLFVQFITII